MILRVALLGEKLVVEGVARSGETEKVTQRERGEAADIVEKHLTVEVWACQSLEYVTHSGLRFLIDRTG